MRVRFAPSPTGHLHVGNARTALFNWLLARGARRHVHPPHRGHRRRALDARVGGGDPRRPALARPRLGRGAGRRRPARTLSPVGAAAPLSVVRAGAARRAAARTTASARRSSSRPSAQAALAAGRPARYCGHAAAACRATQAAARIAAGERAGDPLPRARRTATSSFDDVVRGEVRFQHRRHRRSGHRARRRHARLQLRRRRRRCADGDDACDPRRGSHLEHAAAGPAVRGARLHAAGASRTWRWCMGPDHSAAVEAARRDVGRRVPREGLPARGAGELPRAHRLVAAGKATSDELLPIDELARRFSLDAVGHSAGVFDEEKLAWVNRHYLKVADAAAARRAVGRRSSRRPASSMSPDAAGCDVPGGGDADRDRRRSIGSTRCRRGWRSCSTSTRARRWPMPACRRRDVGRRRAGRRRARWRRSWRRRRGSIASGSARSPNEVKATTGQKGKALFHPIRVALTGEAEGPELDLAVPAIDRGAELPARAGLPAILGCRERAAAFRASARAPTAAEP